MKEFNPYTCTDEPIDVFKNIIEICHSMLIAASEHKDPDGVRAVANRRYKIKKAQAGGCNELGCFTTYDLAGVMFDLYDSGVIDVSYPIRGRHLRLKSGETLDFDELLMRVVFNLDVKAA